MRCILESAFEDRTLEPSILIFWKLYYEVLKKILKKCVHIVNDVYSLYIGLFGLLVDLEKYYSLRSGI
jgi:hypothetical protein